MDNSSLDEKPHGNPSFQLNHVARLISRFFDRRLAPLGVNVANLAVLGALRGSDGLSQKELAEIGRIGQPAMAQMLDRMVKDGLLVRDQDSSDRRKAVFALSKSGIQLMPRVEVALKEGNAEVFSVLTGEELSGMMRVLHRLERHLTLHP